MASILEQLEKQLIRAQREGKTLAQWQADTSAPSSESRMFTVRGQIIAARQA